MKISLKSRLTALLLLCAMALPLASCGTNDPADVPPVSDSAVETPAASQSETEAATEAVTATEPATEAVTATEPATEAVTETEPATEAVTETEPATEAVTETEPATEAVTETEPATEAVTETEPATEAVTETEPATEAVTETEPATEAATETEPATEAPEKEPSDVPGLDITNMDHVVGICYSIWFDQIVNAGIYNISEIEAGKANWGPSPAFHYWGKPAQGYYKSSDLQAARNNMKLIGEAGVDFIIVDMTYMNDSYGEKINFTTANRDLFKPLEAIFDAIHDIRDEGGKAPYVVLWYGSSEKGILLETLSKRYFDKEEYQDCFVYWDGKPFILTWNGEKNFKYPDKFTVRTMLGMTNGKESWNYIAPSNRATVYKRDGVNEQVSVSVACQQGYMSDTHLAYGRQGGKFFNQQWQSAFRLQPKVVTITWWNEWCAQRLPVGNTYKFTDNYNQEYSRDIEPMAGGHGDQYYQWMKQYIAAYKAGEKCPILIEEK